ncbi:late competence protein ComER [Effusibacillus pohliae]|uniref:late competence protein ComER n=1 Tax=Effusibacillus pohliae TaxID=232270 RepID=UPI0003784054|nr:late competence protein ComER [Effusibacillus pohliae]
MRIGFVGTGSMGGMLVRAFVRSHLPNLQVMACNRTASKLEQLVAQYPKVRKLDSASSLAKSCDFLFLCVKPGDVQAVLDDIGPHLSSGQFLVSINSAWSLASLESATPCKVIKIIPSITQEALSGAMLTMYGSRLTSQDREQFETICRSIACPVVIQEEDTRICSDLASCGPAFFAWLLQSFAEAAVRQGGISEEQADHLVKQMIYGLGKLLVEEQYDFAQVVSRVSVPGGITEEGLKVLQPAVQGVFDKLLIATRQKQEHHGKPH